jgi:hypothetical protein
MKNPVFTNDDSHLFFDATKGPREILSSYYELQRARAFYRLVRGLGHLVVWMASKLTFGLITPVSRWGHARVIRDLQDSLGDEPSPEFYQQEGLERDLVLRHLQDQLADLDR